MEPNNNQGFLYMFDARNASPPTLEDITAQCLHRGYLYENITGLTWKQRWFVFKDNNLYYSTSPYSPFADGVVSVYACLVTVIEDTQTTSEFKYQFAVSHPTRKTIYLCARTKEDLNEWVDTFNRSRTKTLNQLLQDVERLIYEKEYVRAREILDELITVDPNNSFVLQKRGIVGYMLYNYTDTLEYLDKADSLDPNNPITLKYRGAVKRCIDDFKEALEDLNTADMIQPNDVFTLYNRGRTRYWRDDMKGAIDDFTSVIKLQPDHAEAYYWRSSAKRSRSNLRGAHKDLHEALRLNIVQLFVQRAAAKKELGDWRGALEDLNKVRELNPNILYYNVTQNEQSKENFNLDTMEDVIDQQPEHGISESNNSHMAAPHNELTGVVDRLTGVTDVPFSELSVIETIGSGGYGEVSAARWHGMKVAIKQLKSNMVAHIAMHEAKTLVLLRCKYIVTLMGITTNPVTHHIVMIMEYMRHGSLDDLLFKRQATLSRDEVIRLALDIAKGVNFLHLHEPKILHRDLKSANVLLYKADRLRAKIADFGFAKYLPSNGQTETVISGGYHVPLPPEMAAEIPYDEKVDVFMFGVVLYEMLTNKRMPSLDEVHRQKRLRDNIADGDFVSLLLDCCMTDPTKRPSMSQVINVLKKMK